MTTIRTSASCPHQVPLAQPECPQSSDPGQTRSSAPSAWHRKLRGVAETFCPSWEDAQCNGYETRCRLLGGRPYVPCEWLLTRGERYLSGELSGFYGQNLAPKPPSECEALLLRQLEGCREPATTRTTSPEPMPEGGPARDGHRHDVGRTGVRAQRQSGLLSGRPCPGCDAPLARRRRWCDRCRDKARRRALTAAQRKWRRKRAGYGSRV